MLRFAMAEMQADSRLQALVCDLVLRWFWVYWVLINVKK